MKIGSNNPDDDISHILMNMSEFDLNFELQMSDKSCVLAHPIGRILNSHYLSPST